MRCDEHTVMRWFPSPSSRFLHVSAALLMLSMRSRLTWTIGAQEDSDSEEFRVFRKQIYHAALAQILSPLRPGMTVPHVMRCPDGHFRRAIFELGPFIADYPEQVYLSGVVQNWCPKYVRSV